MLSKIDLLALPAPQQEVSPNPKNSPPKQIKDFEDGYIELMDEFSLHQFVIRKGKVLDTTPEFLSFKRTYINQWAGISFMIHLLEKLLSDYEVPHAIVNGKALAKLAQQSTHKPNVVQLYDCLSNSDEIGEFIKIPARMFKGQNGTELASISIQKNWRRYKA